MLRGATRDVLNEIERNLHDAFGVARNIILEPLLLPGGGAVEMELAARLSGSQFGLSIVVLGEEREVEEHRGQPTVRLQSGGGSSGGDPP